MNKLMNKEEVNEMCQEMADTFNNALVDNINLSNVSAPFTLKAGQKIEGGEDGKSYRLWAEVL